MRKIHLWIGKNDHYLKKIQSAYLDHYLGFSKEKIISLFRMEQNFF